MGLARVLFTHPTKTPVHALQPPDCKGIPPEKLHLQLHRSPVVMQQLVCKFKCREAIRWLRKPAWIVGRD
jgi:hypothetical protein